MTTVDIKDGLVQGIVNRVIAGSNIYLDQDTGTVTITSTAAGGGGSTLTGLCPYSWIVRREGGTYNAYEGISGSLTYSSDIFHVVVNSVLNTIVGGIIYFPQSTYSLDGTITIPRGGIYFWGEGGGISSTVTIFSYTANGRIRIYNGERMAYMGFYGIRFDGNYLSTLGIDTEDTPANKRVGYLDIVECFVYRFNNSIHPNGLGISAKNAEWWKIDRSYIFEAPIKFSSVDYYTGNNRLTNNFIGYSNSSINATLVTVYNGDSINHKAIDAFTSTGNQYYGTGSGTVTAIYLNADYGDIAHVLSIGDRFEGCAKILDSTVTPPSVSNGTNDINGILFLGDYAWSDMGTTTWIHLGTRTRKNKIAYCDFDASGNTKETIIVSDSVEGETYGRKSFITFNNFTLYTDDVAIGAFDPASTVVKYNSGYISENSGLATIASGGTLNTGLAIVPTKVNLTAKGANPIICSWNTLNTSSSIVIYHSSGSNATIIWEAEI